MKFTIEWIENKTSASGSVYHKASLKDETSRTYNEVAIFGGFEASKLRPGDTIEGEIAEKEFKGKPSYVINPMPKPSGGGYRGAGVAQAQDRKERSIATAQQNKEEGIKISSTARDATLIVSTFYPELAKIESIEEKEEQIRLEWTKWRKWLLDNWNETAPF